jgi:hypothetical protein
VVLDPDEQAQGTICQVFDLFERFRTVGRVLCYLVEHDIRMPVRTPGGPGKGELEWRRANRPTLHNLSCLRTMGSFAQRYVKRHGLAPPFRHDSGVHGYDPGGNIGRRQSSRS